MKNIFLLLLLALSCFAGASIFCLFGICCPLTIGWLVISIIVNSFNGKPFRAISHVFKKIWEAINPSFANLYSSASIIFIVNLLRVIASFFHRPPNFIKRMPLSSFSVSVLNVCLGSPLLLKATAGCSILACEVLVDNKCCCSTITKAFRNPTLWASCMISNYCKATEFFTNYFKFCWHIIGKRYTTIVSKSIVLPLFLFCLSASAQIKYNRFTSNADGTIINGNVLTNVLVSGLAKSGATDGQSVTWSGPLQQWVPCNIVTQVVGPTNSLSPLIFPFMGVNYYGLFGGLSSWSTGLSNGVISWRSSGVSGVAVPPRDFIFQTNLNMIWGGPYGDGRDVPAYDTNNACIWYDNIFNTPSTKNGLVQLDIYWWEASYYVGLNPVDLWGGHGESHCQFYGTNHNFAIGIDNTVEGTTNVGNAINVGTIATVQSGALFGFLVQQNPDGTCALWITNINHNTPGNYFVSDPQYPNYISMSDRFIIHCTEVAQ